MFIIKEVIYNILTLWARLSQLMIPHRKEVGREIRCERLVGTTSNCDREHSNSSSTLLEEASDRNKQDVV